MKAKDQVPRFEPADCPVPAPDTAECGDLVVAEDRMQPGGRMIRLAVAILRSYSDQPAPDSVVYLEGVHPHLEEQRWDQSA